MIRGRLMTCALSVLVAGCNQLLGLEPAAQGDDDGDAPAADAAGDADPGDADPGDATGIDAPPDGPLPGDLDGDGVLDLVDNCPSVWNPFQGDEDGDAEINGGDACDPCPHLGSGGSPHTDGDGDGVGDSCDPRTGTAHCIAWFDGFREGTPSQILARYIVQGGQWSIDGGRARQLDASAASARLLTTSAFATPRVQAGGTIDALPAAAAPGTYRNLFGVLLQSAAAPGSICLASISRTVENAIPVSPPSAVVSSQTPPDGEAFTNETFFPTSTLISPGVAFTADLNLADPPARVAFLALPGAGVQLAVTPLCPDGAAGIRTAYASISFEYLFIVTVRGASPCPPRGPPPP